MFRKLGGSHRSSGSVKAGSGSDGLTVEPIAAIHATLSVTKDSVTGLGVPGLEAALGGLLAVITMVKNVKGNNEELKSFGVTVERFRESITSPLHTNTVDNRRPITPQLKQRLTDLAKSLNAMASKAQKLLSRSRIGKILMNQEDVGVIMQLNQELDRAIQAFMLRGAIVIEAAVEDTRETVREGFQEMKASEQETKAAVEESREVISSGIKTVSEDLGQVKDIVDDTRLETRAGLDQVSADLSRTEVAVTAGFARVSEHLEQSHVAVSTTQLHLLPRAQARYDSQSRSAAHGCFEGTRKSILKTIYNWINSDDPSTPSIFWLCGLAGIGKSTIAHTIAAEEESRHRLGASFFFSRDEADRQNPLLVYPTIAFQLALFDSRLRSLVTEALEQDPDVGLAATQKQFQRLIAEPLREWSGSNGKILIVLDALDECYPESGAEEILVRWATEVRQLPLKVLITSRPELHIRAKFQSPGLLNTSQPYILHDIEQSIVRADIRLFLRHRLNKIAEDHGIPTPWPTDAELMTLVDRAGILFVFAATAVKFIEGGRRRDPQARLNILLKEGVSKATLGYKDMDILYLQVLRSAMSLDEDEEDDPGEMLQTFRTVLGAIVMLRDPLPSGSLESLLSLKPGAVRDAILHLHSVIIVPKAPEGQLRMSHPSFYDFLTDPQRCQDPKFYLNPEEIHAQLAAFCLTWLLKLLKADPCGIGNPWLDDSEVSDLQGRVQAAIPLYLRYCCRHFAFHISRTLPANSGVLELFTSFCESQILTWIETLSLIGEVDTAITSLQVMEDWYKKTANAAQDTVDLLHDAYNMVLRFSAGMRRSSGYIYTSAIPFSPPCSLKRLYASAASWDYVTRGQPSGWDTCTWSNEDMDVVWSLSYSADGGRIVTGDRDGVVHVFNAITSGKWVTDIQCYKMLYNAIQ